MGEPLRDVSITPSSPPYPATTRSAGWRFQLDTQRLRASDTWALASPEVRPWLLMLWTTSWDEIPCGSLPPSDELIAAKIGSPEAFFQTYRAILMRGWKRASDGRYYHETITEFVLDRLEWKRAQAERKAKYRMSHGTDTGQTRDSHVCDDTGGGAGGGAGGDTTSKAKSKPKSAAPAALPDWLPPDDWERWRKHRRQKLTPQAATLQIRKLETLRAAGHDPVALIDAAIESGWATFYPPKNLSPPRGGAQTQAEKRAAVGRAIWGDRRSDDDRAIDGTAERVD